MAEGHTMRMADLARAVVRSPSVLTRLVARPEDRGLPNAASLAYRTERVADSPRSQLGEQAFSYRAGGSNAQRQSPTQRRASRRPLALWIGV